MTRLHIFCREEIEVDVKKELFRIKGKVDTIKINYNLLHQD